MPECPDPLAAPADILFRLGIVALIVGPWIWFVAVQVLPWRRRHEFRPAGPSRYWRVVLWLLSRMQRRRRE